MNALQSPIRLFCHCLYFCLVFSSVQCIRNSVQCNYNEFQSGCADRMGSYCDKVSQKCLCKADHTIRLAEFCFQPKMIGDDCFVSVQCNHIRKAGCFNFREEFNHNPSFFFSHQSQWPSGVCRCRMGHYFDMKTNTCVARIVGSWCSNAWDCRHYEDKRSINPYVCDKNECKCSAEYRYNETTHDCHYSETYGLSCLTRDQCIAPTQCLNNTCDCPASHHLDTDKTPKCQPDNNLNDVRSENSLDVAKGDRTFEIFVLAMIPLVIIFLTLKPCLKKFGKCKPRTDEVISGSKEISIKCTDYDKDLALNQHKFAEKLQTIEEVGEDIKVKDEEEVSGDRVVVADKQIKQTEEKEDKSGPDGKSIDSELAKDNGVSETAQTAIRAISVECSPDSESANS